MLQQFIAEQFEAALIQLKNEISNYTHRDNLWMIDKEIKNPGGTLCLHLLGNLNYFIGTVLGNTGYVRNREAEFTERFVHPSKLIKEIDDTAYRVKTIIPSLTDEQLRADFPVKVHLPGKTTEERLIFLLGHLNYHLGQINYHRRLLDPPVSLPDGVNKLESKTVASYPENP